MFGHLRGHSLLVASVVSFASLAWSVRAQQVLFEIDGSDVSNPIDVGVVIGDWDGDGVRDIALRSEFDDTVAQDAGAVEIRSGKDGSLLQTLYGVGFRDYFGDPVAMPDVDGDGIPDLLVLDDRAQSVGFGSADLFAGGSGRPIWHLDGTALLGGSGGPVADFDGDGVPDVYVTEVGALYIVSGSTGTILSSITGSTKNFFGFTSTTLGDVNGDGLDDFLVAAPTADLSGIQRGRAYVYSGADQSLLAMHHGRNDYEGFGISVARIGDVDGDGLRDYAIGSQWEDVSSNVYTSIVRVYSSATHALLGEIHGDDPYLISPTITPLGDVNRDGIEDFALIADPPWKSAAKASILLFSGRTLTRLYDFEDLEPTGHLTGDAGDFDGDGFPDLLAATRDAGGRFRVYSGNDLWLDATLHAVDPNDFLALSTGEEPAGNLTVLAIVGLDGTPLFQLVGGLGKFDATGHRVLSDVVPPGLSGHALDFRSYALDARGRVVDSATETITFR